MSALPMRRKAPERGPVERPLILSAQAVTDIFRHGKRQHRIRLPNVPESPAMDAIRPGARVRHPAPYLDAYCSAERTEANPRGMSEVWCWWTRDDRAGADFRVPAKPGDVFRVCERWAETTVNGIVATIGKPWVVYEAEDSRTDYGGPWRSAVGMPRHASRLYLAVTGVRVERLDAISDADALAEGCRTIERPGEAPCYVFSGTGYDRAKLCHSSPSVAFAVAYSERHAPGSWDESPWVAAIEFSPLPTR